MLKLLKGKSTLFRLEVIGTLFSIIASTLLHFSYDWSSGSILSIIFAAANESVWEHIKILTLPYLIWMLIEMSIYKLSLKKLVVAKTAGVYSIAILTILVHKAYTAILGYSISFVDILCAFIWIAVGFIVSYKLLTLKFDYNKFFTVAIFSLILFLVMFITFTVNPPHIDIFMDPITQNYGIPKNNFDVGAVYLDTITVV